MKKLHKTGIAIISALAPAAALGITAGVVVASLPKQEANEYEAVWDENDEIFATENIEMVAGQEYTIYANIDESLGAKVNNFLVTPGGRTYTEFSNHKVILDGNNDTENWQYLEVQTGHVLARSEGGTITKGVVKVTFTATVTQTAYCVFLGKM